MTIFLLTLHDVVLQFVIIITILYRSRSLYSLYYLLVFIYY